MEPFLRGHRISQMKQANHNEVDLLLRSLARGRERAAWPKSGDADQVASGHLDADELNSYAEGLAPAPARARYIEHLADCDTCRGIVVGLTQAAGAANRFEVPERKGGANFWQKLSALFSPPVLRYAVPVLLLTAVIGIGLLALKQQQGTRFDARNEPELARQPSAQGDTGAVLHPTPESAGKASSGAGSGTGSESTKEKSILRGEKIQAGQEPPVSESSVAKAAVPKDSEQTVDRGSVAESRPYALEPKATAAPPPASVMDAEKSTELAKEGPAKREDQARDQDEAFRTESDDVQGPNRSRNNTAQSASRSAGVMGGRGPSGVDKKKAAEVETRTVMGRHFTRDGGAWVDTAYESSRATVRVTRGSDRFSALVADEPGIRTIADQLDGVVIVVWKGRAYRIQ